MFRAKSALAVFLCGLMALPAFAQTQAFTLDTGGSFIDRFTSRYRAHRVGEVSFADSPRIEKLMRAGVIYLSLRDAIALALENNLDIESARYLPKLGLADLQRASAGQLLRNVSTNISQGVNSASLGVLAGATAVNAAGQANGGGSQTGVLSGLNVQLAGSTIPNVDPVGFVAAGYNHQTQIQTSTVFTGTSSLVSNYKNLTYGVQQGFWTGTSATLALTSVFGYNQNATTAIFNPIDTGTLALNIQQNLLNGFGLAVNKRAYHKARNNLRVNDLTFKSQVMATVTNVVNLYWDLVQFNDDLKVKRQSLQLNTQLYTDNQKRAELGAIAPIDIIQAEADMKASQQDVITEESQVFNQEMILKSVLTRSGLDNPAVAMARIVPTDHVEVPAQEPVIPIQDLLAEALAARPEVEQNQISLENARLDLLGTRNNLLPTLQAYLNMSNVGQAGAISTTPIPIYDATGHLLGYRPLNPSDVNQFLVGGYGTVLGQLFSRNFPNYSAGFQLTIPLRNRANQADMVTSELQYRQSQIQDKQLHNNIKLNVMNAWTTVRNARAAYDTAVVARKLQEETLAGTRRKYELGTATILDVIISQRDTTARQLAEADSRNQYQRARTNLEQQLGKILEDYGVNLDEAKGGVVSREPDLLPAVQQNR